MKRRNVIGAAAALVAFVLFGEGWARLTDFLWYGGSPLANPSMADLAMADSGGLRGRPGARFERWSMNANGVQGDELVTPRPPGLTRVVVLGASEMFGLYESRGMSTSEQLRRRLSGSGPVEVANGALAGLSLPRTTEFCRRQLTALDPSVVVYYPNPVTYLNDDVPAETFRPPAPPSEAFRSRLLPRLFLLLNRAIPGQLQAWRAESGARRFLASQRASHPPEWAYHAVPAERLAAFDRHLEDLIQAIPAGVRLVLASHAHRYHDPLGDEDRVQIVAWQAFYPRADADVLIGMERAANARVREAAARNGLGFADVAARVPPGERYFRDFTHFTDEGAALAAEAMADAIRASGAMSSVR